MLSRDVAKICFSAIISITLLPSLTISFGLFADQCPGNEVQNIRKQADQFEVSLVFYYVSWSAESLKAKTIYDEVELYYFDQVYFAKVDCWHLACNCTRVIPARLGKGLPNKWPTLIAHYGRRISLQYQGEWNFAALARFLNNLFKPVERINNRNDLKVMSTRNDAIILGLFPDSDCAEYRQYVTAAVKWLETDPERSFRFATAFGKAADNILNGMHATKSVILLINSKGIETFNTSESNVAWNAQQILIWLHAELKRIIGNTYGYNTLANIGIRAKQGSVLAVLANNLSTEEDIYTILLNLIEIPNSSSIISRSLFCIKYWNNDHFRDTDTNNGVHKHLQEMFKKSKHASLKNCSNGNYLNSRNIQYYYIINRYLNYFFETFQSQSTIQENDDISAEKLLKLYLHNKCLQYPHYSAPEVKIIISKFLKKSVDAVWRNSMTNHNRTLSVVFLNSGNYQDYLKKNEIINIPKSPATVFIVDTSKESTYVMEEVFTYEALLKFIKNYYEDNLIAHTGAGYFQKKPSAPNTYHLHEYNRQMLSDIIKQQNITIVALLYSPTCYFSTIMSQTLIQVSALINTENIKFIRINTQTNKLPWQYVMSRTPTLMVFPRNQSTDSIVFPAHHKVTVGNVFGFILAQLEPIEQVKVAFGSCSPTFLPQRLQNCLQFAKTLVMQHIGDHLKLWQSFEKDRSIILDRLKQFKDIHLNIQRSFKH